MPDIAVHVRGVSKRFVQGNYYIDALKNVNFDARFNELMMIVGPSGSGKTTLLSVIAGTLNFDRGEVEVLGHDLHAMSDEEKTGFRREQVGFIFQQFHLIPTLTCQENVSIPLLLNKVPFREAEAKAADLLREVGLAGREGSRPKHLSVGQQQRVAIARALVHEPKLLICDEPTASLDADTGQHVMELLEKIAHGTNRCVIVVTHDNRIFPFGDRIVRMSDGVIAERNENNRGKRDADF